MSKSIFSSPEGRERLEHWYNIFLDKAKKPVTETRAQTSFGNNHVLVAGNPGSPPLIGLHAMRTSSAHLFSELRSLANHRHLILPDIPGHSPLGLDQRLSFKDTAHADWLAEVLDSLQIEQCDLVGVSLGGFIARQFATAYPDRVGKLVLLVPAGIVQGSLLKGLTRMAWPMIRYRMKPDEKRLRRLVGYLITEWDNDWAHYLGDSFVDFSASTAIPPVASGDELSALSQPVLIMGADEDISFPGKPMIERAKRLIPNVETELLEDTRHCPPTNERFRSWFAERVLRFLED